MSFTRIFRHTYRLAPLVLTRGDEDTHAMGKSKDVIGQCSRTLQKLSSLVIVLTEDSDDLKARLQSLHLSHRYA